MPKQTKVYRNFSGGLNNRASNKDIEDNELLEAYGVVVDEKGLIRTSSPKDADGGAKIAGLTNHSAKINEGTGLFSFKSDLSWANTVNDIAIRESEYICIGDSTNGEIDLWGYDDTANDHDMNTGVIDLGGAAKFEFYYADGALRVTDVNFSGSNTTKWFGPIYNKKLLGEGSIQSTWLSINNDLAAPTVGFVSPSLSGTADATLSSTTVLGLPSGSASTGSVTAWATSNGFAQATSASHNLSVGDVITLVNAPAYNGTHTISSVPDGNNFVLKAVPFIHNPASGTWVKAAASETFQGWSSAVSSANSASRWLIAYDVSANDIWKITALNESGPRFTTDTNSVAAWDNRSVEIYPYPGDGILLEAYQSEGNSEGSWQEGNYEFAQSFIYEGNQESKLKKLEGDDIPIDPLQILYARIHVSGLDTEADNASLINQRLIGGRVYIRKSGANDFWSLLIDMDFRTNKNGEGGGTRLSTIDNYDEWSTGTVRDADTGGSSSTGFTNTNFRGYKSKQYSVKRMSIESYENLNGFSSNEYALSFGEAAGYGYKASVVAGQRVFVANVKYIDHDTGVEKIMGDTILYTPIGKYDTFPSSYKLEIAGNDGDEFTALEYSNGILFAFKKNALYLIDVSNSNDAAWRLITVHSGMGVIGSHSVTKTSLGICWASKSGVYLFVENRPIDLLGQKISKSYWSSFFNLTNGAVIGWDSQSNKLLIIDNHTTADKTLIYDFESQSWTNGWPLATSPGWSITGGANSELSNMISFTGNEIKNSSNASILYNGGILIYSDDATDNLATSTGDLSIITFTDTVPSAFAVSTKDDDFGYPNINKKIYEFYLEYITNDELADIDIRYEVNGNDFPNSGSTGLLTNESVGGGADTDNVNLLVAPFSTPVICRSISFRVSSEGTSAPYFKIISMGVRFRPIMLQTSSTETSSS